MLTEEQITGMAELIQKKLHDEHLPGYYFAPEDVEQCIRCWLSNESLPKESAFPSTDKYFLDRRCHRIRKNLDVQWIAPELWVEVQVDDTRNGMFKYTYERHERRLDWLFTNDQLNQSNVSFFVQERMYLESHGFVKAAPPVRRIMYVSQEVFDGLLMKEEE